jgi:DNA-binding transcriptional ArsR family regulator
MVTTQSSPFGSRTRTRVLLILSLLGESYAREIARLLGGPLSGVQAALKSLERDGLVGGRLVGRVRLVRLDPRYPARVELASYVARLTAMDNDLRDRAATLRRRPRQAGKPR